MYLHNEKDFERTLNMFLTQEGLPKNNESTEIEVKVIESAVKRPDSKKPIDYSSYVLEEYANILMPNKRKGGMSRIELENQKALTQLREEEDETDREVRAKILRLAQTMLYDDDIEESTITADREKAAERPRTRIER